MFIAYPRTSNDEETKVFRGENFPPSTNPSPVKGFMFVGISLPANLFDSTGTATRRGCSYHSAPNILATIAYAYQRGATPLGMVADSLDCWNLALHDPTFSCEEAESLDPTQPISIEKTSKIFKSVEPFRKKARQGAVTWLEDIQRKIDKEISAMQKLHKQRQAHQHSEGVAYNTHLKEQITRYSALKSSNVEGTFAAQFSAAQFSVEDFFMPCVRWDTFIQHPLFSECLNEIVKKYNQNSAFREKCDHLVSIKNESLVPHHSQRRRSSSAPQEDTPSDVVSHSSSRRGSWPQTARHNLISTFNLCYLLEELAVAELWARQASCINLSSVCYPMPCNLPMADILANTKVEFISLNFGKAVPSSKPTSAKSSKRKARENKNKETRQPPPSDTQTNTTPDSPEQKQRMDWLVQLSGLVYSAIELNRSHPSAETRTIVGHFLSAAQLAITPTPPHSPEKRLRTPPPSPEMGFWAPATSPFHTPLDADHSTSTPFHHSNDDDGQAESSTAIPPVRPQPGREAVVVLPV